VAALLSVLSSLLVGIVLVFAPWTSLWDSNWLLQLWPGLRGFLTSAFTRGAVTGLGLVNVGWRQRRGTSFPTARR
jgi:hypothetical protein